MGEYRRIPNLTNPSSPIPKVHVQQHLDDPAIASIGPPSNSGKRGGFGEGFGFGGGIGGGRALGGRGGGRNIGSYGGQMGKFSVRNSGNTPMRFGAEEDRRREDEWRRSDKDNNSRLPRDARDTRRPNYAPREEDTSEPAWMDDITPADPAIVDNAEPLVQFVPGEDMIAAHKRAMRSKDNGGDWRGDVGLPAFFGGDPAIASSSAPAPPPGLKPKSFNAADYLKQAEELSDDEAPLPVSQPAPPASAFSSRFQKFFSPQAESPSATEAKPVEEVKDDRTARLMAPAHTQSYTPSPNDQIRHLSSTSAPNGPPAHLSPNFYGAPDGPPPPSQPPSHANALLQQLYGNSQDRQLPPDPLQLLNQAQRQGYQQPPHMSVPPQFIRPPPNMYHQEESGGDMSSPGYPPQNRQPPFVNGLPPPGFMPPPPPFLHHGPPRPPGYPMPNYPPQHQPPYPPPGSAQQDMLATLFAGLGPRS
ncbi:uncharacterized protein L201_007361 [Kwoniella dendrophila CBS 6074]|uniref:Uncharacterized protein n=1 Tax=Kwoniella dendrophila CBS 6074 TaxID=1295534 RepID=A0AAX4K5J7_9TREE